MERPQPAPARREADRSPWDSGSSSSWGRDRAWLLAAGPPAAVLGAGSLQRGPGRAGWCQPGGRPQLVGPEKASCEAAGFATLTNKVFFSF